MTLKVCLIGAGRAGHFHTESISKSPNIDLKVIVDLNIKKSAMLSTEYNKDYVSYSDDIDNILRINVELQSKETGFDAVIVASPTRSHYEMTMKALENNCHVFCEKPLGTKEQIIECFKLSKEKNLKLLIGFQKRFDNNYTSFINMVHDNLPCKQLTMITRDYPLPSMEYLKTSNGIVEDMISHDIDITNCVMKFEKPEEVFAFSHTSHPKLVEIDEIEDISILMYYKSGTIVTLHGSRTSNYAYDQRAEAFTSNKLIQMDNKKYDTITTVSDTKCGDGVIHESFPDRYRQAYESELEYFVKMIEQKLDSPITCEHMLLNVQICDAINKSLEIKEKMPLKYIID